MESYAKVNKRFMMKAFMVGIIATVMAVTANAATFEWSFLVNNSQSGVAPVSVTAYLYTSDYGIWVGDGSFNHSTLILADAMFGIEYSPVGYPVIVLAAQVSPLTEGVSKFTISWETDPTLDTLADCPMNQHAWTFVLVDNATPDYFSYGNAAFYSSFWPGHWDEQWDYTHLRPSDLGWLLSVPEPSTALLALSGLSALLLRRRRPDIHTTPTQE